MSESPDTAIDRLTTIVKELDSSYKEMQELNNLAPDSMDYTVEGLQKFSEHINKARANSERAASVQAAAIRLASRARAINLSIKEGYQSIYDEVVEKENVKISHLSWEERGSIYRLRVLDARVTIHKSERSMILIDGLISAIDVLGRSVQKARNDLVAIVDVLKFGERVGDF